jgi:ArsR family transcriptional regulator, virulence genes transcriptional regulator
MARANKAKAKQEEALGERLEAMREHAGDAARMMKALAHESRLLVLCTLSEGEMSVGQLNERIDLSQSALSQHLGVLRRGGLVTTRRESQTIYYSLADGPAHKLIDVLHGIYCG